MNRIWKSTLLDARIIFRYSLPFLVFAYVISSAIGYFTPDAFIMPILSLLISSISIGMFFSLYEKNNLSKLYGTLPIRRSDVVAGRFLYAAIFGIANLAIATLLTYLFGVVIKQNITGPDLSMALSAGFLYYCIIISLQNPVYFRFGFTRAYILSNLPFYLLFIGSLFIARRGGGLTFIHNTYAYFTIHPGMAWLIGIGGGLLLGVLSLLLSQRLFKKADI